MGTSSERIFNGSGKGYLPAGTIGNRTHILSERLKAGTEFKRLKKGHRPAPMPPTWTHILSYKPDRQLVLIRRLSDQVLNSIIEAEAGQLHCSGVNSRNIYCECILKTCSVDIVVALYYEVTQVVTGN